MQLATFVKMYAQAQQRATVCAAPTTATGTGLSFQKDDRVLLVNALEALGAQPQEVAETLKAQLGGTYATHVQRLNVFKRQVAASKLRTVGPGKCHTVAIPSVARVDKEVQAAFDQVATRLVKIGVTDEQAAQSYLSRAFIKVRANQKIESKAERIEQELRLGDLDKTQVLEVLSRVQARF
ncbi:hypothetical protein uav_019 [Pseudomonas phage UAVern]|uniref:Uncharacterized protein n=1 Tax=Pseudomonas phage UAVern TaxID=2856997 RepID=A0A975YZ62_9CAUD|nr:hypothetical protein uav_019 [Pseudomonas phage UAVern]